MCPKRTTKLKAAAQRRGQEPPALQWIGARQRGIERVVAGMLQPLESVRGDDRRQQCR